MRRFLGRGGGGVAAAIDGDASLPALMVVAADAGKCAAERGDGTADEVEASGGRAGRPPKSAERDGVVAESSCMPSETAGVAGGMLGAGVGSDLTALARSPSAAAAAACCSSS